MDFFYPKKCVNCRKFSEYLCSDCFSFISFDVKAICAVCGRQSFNCQTHTYCLKKYEIDGVFSSVTYGRVIKKLIYALKYSPNIKEIAEFAAELAYEGIIQNEFFEAVDRVDSCMVPIPLHKKRLKQRGYNQSLLIAENLSDKLSMPVIDGLERIRSTDALVKLSKKERKEMVKGCFRIRDDAKHLSKKVFLVDDVFTTGSTLLEAAKVLKGSGVYKVYGLTLAHGV